MCFLANNFAMDTLRAKETMAIGIASPIMSLKILAGGNFGDGNLKVLKSWV